MRSLNILALFAGLAATDLGRHTLSANTCSVEATPGEGDITICRYEIPEADIGTDDADTAADAFARAQSRDGRMAFMHYHDPACMNCDHINQVLRQKMHDLNISGTIIWMDVRKAGPLRLPHNMPDLPGKGYMLAFYDTDFAGRHKNGEAYQYPAEKDPSVSAQKYADNVLNVVIVSARKAYESRVLFDERMGRLVPDQR